MKFLFHKHLSRLLLTILWSFVIVITQHASVVSLSNNETVPAVIVFGDSIVDTGNNNYIITLFTCNFQPYGKDFGGGNQPTGRFSNGIVAADIIAAKFGVKKILPAYLDPKLQPHDLLTGVSFASAGSGYDPLTSKLASVLSLANQLDKFREYKSKIEEIVGENRTTTIISKGVYILCTGSNDIIHTYFLSLMRQAHYDITAYTDLMTSQATNFLQDLYELGARKIGVTGVPPLGCVPSQRTIRGGLLRNCSAFVNHVSRIFNTKLSSQIDVLNKKISETRLIYLDIYNPLLNMIQNPAKYGFEVTNKGCCGTGNIEAGPLCNPFTPQICSNTKSYIFWDGLHLTQEAYNVLSSLVFDNKIKNFF